MNKQIIGVIAAVAIIGAGSFYGGMKYTQNKSVSDRQQRFGRTAGTNMSGKGGSEGGLVSGDIISKDSQSITVKMRDGSSKIVFFSDMTEVSKFIAGASADLAVGKTVTVIGKANSDGSITATTARLQPNMPNPNPAK